MRFMMSPLSLFLKVIEDFSPRKIRDEK